MMADVTIAPSVEAANAIVSRLNAGTAYCIPVKAAWTEQIIDLAELGSELQVDVVTEDEEQLEDTLAVETRSSHHLRVWIRQRVEGMNTDDVQAFKLLVRQVFQQLSNYDTTDGRVKTWECEVEQKSVPDKAVLRDRLVAVASIILRVEVEAP